MSHTFEFPKTSPFSYHTLNLLDQEKPKRVKIFESSCAKVYRLYLAANTAEKPHLDLLPTIIIADHACSMEIWSARKNSGHILLFKNQQSSDNPKPLLLVRENLKHPQYIKNLEAHKHFRATHIEIKREASNYYIENLNCQENSTLDLKLIYSQGFLVGNPGTTCKIYELIQNTPVLLNPLNAYEREAPPIWFLNSGKNYQVSNPSDVFQSLYFLQFLKKAKSRL